MMTRKDFDMIMNLAVTIVLTITPIASHFQLPSDSPQAGLLARKLMQRMDKCIEIFSHH